MRVTERGVYHARVRRSCALLETKLPPRIGDTSALASTRRKFPLWRRDLLYDMKSSLRCKAVDDLFNAP
jgi:hypothetical protein